MNIAIIPARGGSKRIPRKNIKDFCGKPIIAYSIETALESGLFDKVIVSTDDEEIAEVAKKYGAEIPFMRPKELADDYTGTLAVATHAIQHFQKLNIRIKYACIIYPTAPFLTADTLNQGLIALEEHHADYSFAATRFNFPILRALKVNPNGHASAAFPEFIYSRSQDLDEHIHDAGQFYWAKAKTIVNNIDFYSSKLMPVILPHNKVQDIDTLEDFQHAEFLYNFNSSRYLKGKHPHAAE